MTTIIAASRTADIPVFTARSVMVDTVDYTVNATQGSTPEPEEDFLSSSSGTTEYPYVTNHTTSSVDVYVYDDVISFEAVRLVMIISYVVFCLLAICGNGLVIVVICKRKKLRKNPTILFILNLAFSDLVSCLLYRPLLLLELCLPFSHIQYPAFHLEQCKMASFFQGLFAATGFLTMVAISQERLLLIVYPLKAKDMCSAGTIKKVLLVIWVVSTCTALPIPLRYSQIMTLNLRGVRVSLCGSFDHHVDAGVYFTLLFVCYFSIPLVVMSVSYVKIFIVLYTRPKRLDVNQDAGGGKSMRVRRNLAKMMMSVSVIFALCWGPNFLYFLFLAAGGSVPSNGFFIAALVEFLPIISSGVNPCLYTLNSRTFRTAIKSLLLRRRVDDTLVTGRSFHHSQSPYSLRGSVYSCNSPSLSFATFGAVSPPSTRRHTDSPLRAAMTRNMYHRQMSCPLDSQDRSKVTCNGSVEKVGARSRGRGVLRRSQPVSEEPAEAGPSTRSSLNVDSVKPCSTASSWGTTASSWGTPAPAPALPQRALTLDHPGEDPSSAAGGRHSLGRLQRLRGMWARQVELVGIRKDGDTFV